MGRARVRPAACADTTLRLASRERDHCRGGWGQHLEARLRGLHDNFGCMLAYLRVTGTLSVISTPRNVGDSVGSALCSLRVGQANFHMQPSVCDRAAMSRIAVGVATALLEQGKAAMFILDDILAYSDRHRLNLTCDALSRTFERCKPWFQLMRRLL